MAWQVNVGKLAKENADYAKEQGDYAKETGDSTNAAILEANNKVDEVEALRVATNDVKEQTEIVRDDTEAERLASVIVREATDQVKENTEAVRVATENVRANTEAERIATANERAATAEERQATATERAATKIVKDATEAERQALAAYKNGVESRVVTVEEKATNAETLSKEAKARADLIIGNTGSANTEIVDSRLGADLVARATAGGLIREIHANQLETARQTTTLTNGVSVISGGVDALAETEVEGRTLIPLPNSNLEAGKQYVLADKKTKVIVDGITQSGVAKFTKGTTTVSTANYLNKVYNSTVANPHKTGVVIGSTTLVAPNPSGENIGTIDISKFGSLNNDAYTYFTKINGGIMQHQFSFDIIAEIERKLGIIPKSTLAEKIQWAKDNGESLQFNWHGLGSSVGGNRADITIWNVGTGVWEPSLANHVLGTVQKLTAQSSALSARIDVNGFVHLLAYAPASDGITASSISTDFIDLVITLKATAQLNTRPTIIRVENFEGKINGSFVENPHVAKRTTATGTSATLLAPTGFTYEFSNANEYGNLFSLNGSMQGAITSVSGAISQQLFSFNLIEVIERNVGKIPRSSVADKVQWLKDNVARFTGYWSGFGSSVGGNKATFTFYNFTNSSYDGGNYTNTTSQVVKIARTAPLGYLSNIIDANGFAHFLAYAEPSDGTTASTINTDFIDLEIELKPTADFTRPKVALYEVTADSYAKILVDWSADEVINRYPSVEGVQHLQGVGVIAESENLFIPPSGFEERMVDGELCYITNNYTIPMNYAPNTRYTFTAKGKYVGGFALWLKFEYTDGTISQSSPFLTTLITNSVISSVGKTVKSATLMQNTGSQSVFSGAWVKDSIQLTIGTTVKPYTPYNPSYYFADVKLGAIGTVTDRLYEQDGSKFVRKVVEKDVVLGGDKDWSWHFDYAGFKSARFILPTNGLANTALVVSDYRGKLLNIKVADANNTAYSNNVTLFTYFDDTDTGFGETFVPSVAEIKAYFYGYKMNNGVFGTNYDYTGTKTWTPIGDTTNARAVTVVPTSASPTQLDGTIQPYKLSYVLATPQIINVTDKVEGSLKVNGLTQVEALSGIVRREKVTPISGGGSTFINTAGQSLVKRNSKILAIYKNGIIDKSWGIVSHGGANIGIYGSNYATGSGSHDPTALYEVTYIVLEKEKLTANPTNIKLLYANNMRSSLEDVTGKLQDGLTQLSVHEKAIIDLYVRLKAIGG